MNGYQGPLLRCMSVFLFVGLCLTGCSVAPKPVLQLTPVADESAYILGDQYVQVHDDDLAMTASCLETNGDYLLFHVEFVNLSDRTLMVDPAWFYYRPQISQTDSMTFTRVYAENPEAHIQDLDLQVKEEDASLTNYRRSDSTSSLFDLLDSIILAGRRTDEEIAEAEADAAERKDRLYTREDRHYEKIISLNEVRDTWCYDTLRMTSLGPRQKVQGCVLYSKHYKANYLKFVFPIGSLAPSVLFEQGRVVREQPEQPETDPFDDQM